MTLLALLLACGESSENDLSPVVDPGITEEPAATEPPDEPYIAEEDPIEPALSLDEVSEAITQVIATAKSIQGNVLFDGYAASLAGRSTSCPYTNPDYAELYGIDYWYDSCTASSGTVFNGYGYGYVYAPFWSGTYYYSDYAYLYGDAEITTPDGSQFTAAGTAYYYHYDESTYDYGNIQFYAFGEFGWDAPEAASTWLASGVSSTLTISATDYRLWNAKVVLFDGGISRLQGTANAVVFDRLYASDAGYGSPCEAEPGGMVSVRDDEGEWYDVSFDGADYGSDVAFPPECDGCGHVWFRGAYLGDVCPDLGGLLSWEDWSW